MINIRLVYQIRPKYGKLSDGALPKREKWKVHNEVVQNSLLCMVKEVKKLRTWNVQNDAVHHIPILKP